MRTKNFFGIFVILSSLLVFVSPVLGAPSIGDLADSLKGQEDATSNIITDPSQVPKFVTTAFSEGKVFDPEFWETDWLNIILYIVAPLLLMFFILLGIMEELNFFSTTIRFALAIVLSILAIPAGILSGTLAFAANAGVMITMIIVLVTLFLLGVSHWYRKRLDQYQFFMGSKWLTILIMNIPLIFGFAAFGFWLGGLLLAGASTLITVLLAIGLLVAAVLFAWKKEGGGVAGKELMVGGLGILIIIGMAIFGVAAPKLIAQIAGLILGVIVAFLFIFMVGLQQKTRYVHKVVEAAEAKIDNYRKEIKRLEGDKQKLIIRINSAGPNEDVTALNDQIISIQKDIESFYTRIDDEIKKAEEQEIRDIWDDSLKRK